MLCLLLTLAACLASCSAQPSPYRTLPEVWPELGRRAPLVKKDVFMSRGWGAGGMPFSVLYMHPQQQQQQQKAAVRSMLAGVEQMAAAAPPRVAQALPLEAEPENPYQQIALRNIGGGHVLPSRRQYSIIPQLFVSYGWGPLGK